MIQSSFVRSSLEKRLECSCGTANVVIQIERIEVETNSKRWFPKEASDAGNFAITGNQPVVELYEEVEGGLESGIDLSNKTGPRLF